MNMSKTNTKLHTCILQSSHINSEWCDPWSAVVTKKKEKKKTCNRAWHARNCMGSDNDICL